MSAKFFAINFIIIFRRKDTNRLLTIHPNETIGADIHVQFSQTKCVGAVPVCPPERPRSGVSIPKIYALCAGITMDAPLCGGTGGHTGTAPTHLHQTTRCALTSLHCTFDSSRQPCGVPLPHRGYTFDSAGLASATQPTLGNNASEEATPLGVVLFPSHCFLMSSPHNTRGRKCIAHSRPHS